jgi:peptidoglycan/LPS O-acetylase OafA/YrhL
MNTEVNLDRARSLVPVVDRTQDGCRVMEPTVERSHRYQSLDVWRGVACLMVVVHHAAVAVEWDRSHGPGLEGWLRRGVLGLLGLGLGPPLFFVMSGYCVAANIDSLRRKQANPLGFLAKRLWRIFPPYWVALLGFVAVIVGLDALGLNRLHGGLLGLEQTSPATLTRAQWLGNITLTESWRPLLGGDEANIFTRIAWSLCYQEQFYLVCFLVLLAAPRRFHTALAATTAAILGVYLLAFDSGSLYRLDGTFPVLWHEFAVGLAVYWRFQQALPRRARWGIDLGLAGLLVVAVLGESDSTVNAAALGLVLIGLRRWDGPIAGLPGLAPLRACGRRCYSIYLVHLPICTVGNHCLYECGVTGFWARVLVMVPLVTLASVGAGWVFYHAVESRFLQLPDLRRARSAWADGTEAIFRGWDSCRLPSAGRPGLRLLALGAAVAAVVVVPPATAARVQGLPSGTAAVVGPGPGAWVMGRTAGCPAHRPSSRGPADVVARAGRPTPRRGGAGVRAVSMTASLRARRGSGSPRSKLASTAPDGRGPGRI